jgi:hypothetical protein
MSRTVLPRQVPVLLAAGLTLASPLWLFAVQAPAAVPDPPNPPRSIYIYVVKIVCATDSRDGGVDFAGFGPSLGSTDDVLADADLFQTAVNVFNTHIGEAADLRTNVILAHSPGDDRMVGHQVRVRVEAGDAVEFGCEHFRNESGAARVPGGTGFFRIESSQELVVAAVYTVVEKSGCNSGARTVLPGRRAGTDCHGAGVSMDVEYITPKVVPLPNQP